MQQHEDPHFQYGGKMESEMRIDGADSDDAAGGMLADKQQFEAADGSVNGARAHAAQDGQRHQNNSESGSSDQGGNGQTKGTSSCFIDVHKGRPIRLQVKVIVPVRDHPNYNFVGKLLGPKGNSLKKLQEDTHTRMAILGRGSMRDKNKEEELRAQGDPKHAHLNEDLHVEITAFAPAADAYSRMAHALTEIKRFLVPDYYDDIRQNQLRELAMMNGERRKNAMNQDGRSGSPVHGNTATAESNNGSVVHSFNTGRPTLPPAVASSRAAVHQVRSGLMVPPPPMANVPRPNPAVRSSLSSGGVGRVPVARPGRMVLSSAVGRTPATLYRKSSVLTAMSPKESRAALVPDEDCYMYEDGYGVETMGDIYEDDYVTIGDSQYLDYEDPYADPRGSEDIHENGSFTNYAGEDWKVSRASHPANGRLKASPPSRIVMRNGHREPPYGPTQNSRFQ